MITHLIPLEEAARRLGIKPRTLLRYAKSGKIRAKLFVVDNGERMMLVELKEIREIEKSQRPGAKDEEMKDEEISLREASRRYGIPHPLLSRWIRIGILELRGRAGREYRVSARAVEELAKIYHEVRARHGRFKGRRMRKILRERGLLPD